jgi:CBS domain-containing protein
MRDITVLQAKRLGIYSCTSAVTLHEAAKLMVTEDISGLVVLDPDGYLAGVITRTDLLRSARAGADWRLASVEEYMNSQVVTVAPEDLLSHVTRTLLEHGIHRAVIVQSENEKLRPVGVISDADLIYHMIKDD